MTIYCKTQAFHISNVQCFALFTIKPPEAPKNTSLSNHQGQFDVFKKYTITELLVSILSQNIFVQPKVRQTL